ncbi:MAG: iron ABC transporter permease [Ignavibacteriales bacterium]|nr:iron ABC transporter permease [Ignavibacteriales bacterium]
MTLLSRNKITFTFFLLLLGIFFFFDILLGSVRIPIMDAFNIITGSSSRNSTWATIITAFRIPKAITAVLAGSALSVSGLLMQTFFRNPLADPFVLGISSGASLGVALVILTANFLGLNLFFLSNIFNKLSTTVAAGIGASVILVLITFISKKISSNITLLIFGLMLGYIIGAFESILKYFSSPEALQGFVIWGMGNFGNVIWSDLLILIPTILFGLTIAFLLSKSLNLFLLGENYAVSMGMNLKVIRLLIIVIVGILGGVITAFCGPIAFIGIAVPHMTRKMMNEYDHKILIPAVALVGSSLALFCDIISQLIWNDQTIPINIVTSLVGAPVVMWIILQQRKIKHTIAMD